MAFPKISTGFPCGSPMSGTALETGVPMPCCKCGTIGGEERVTLLLICSAYKLTFLARCPSNQSLNGIYVARIASVV